MSEWAKGKQAARELYNKEYIDMLDNVDARQSFFGALTNPADGDHSEVLKVKSKIR